MRISILFTDTAHRVPTIFRYYDVGTVFLPSVIVGLLLCLLPVAAQMPLYDLPDPYANPVITSGTLAISRGGRLVISNELANRVTIFNPFNNAFDAELFIGNAPQGIVVTPDSTRALALSESGLTVIDLNTNEAVTTFALPDIGYTVVASDTTAYVASRVASVIWAVNLEDGSILSEIGTASDPAGLALWGDFLYVTHYWSGELSLIYLPAAGVVRTIETHPQASLSNAIVIDPIGGLAYLPQTINNINADTRSNRMIPVVQVVDLETLFVNRMINLIVADSNVSMPYAAAQPTNRSRLYLAHAGSDAVTVLNLDTDTAEQHVETGANPRGILFNRGFTQFYVQDTVDGTLTIINTAFFTVDDTVPTHSQSISPQLQLGAQQFHHADDLISCASCHENNFAETPTLEWLQEHRTIVQGGIPLTTLDLQALVDYLRE